MEPLDPLVIWELLESLVVPDYLVYRTVLEKGECCAYHNLT